MRLARKGDVVFQVSRGENSRWDVNERGFDKPLASFDSERDACSYAKDLARTRRGSKVVVQGRELIDRLGLPARR